MKHTQEHPALRKMGHVISACPGWKHKKHLLLDEHHIFGGPNRMHSEETGLKVWLCLDHHTMGTLAVHRCPDTMRLMHRIGQQEYEKTHTGSSY